MKLIIPEDALTARLYQVGDAIIMADEGESIIDVAIAIMMASIGAAKPVGLGAVFAGSMIRCEQLISEEEAASLRQDFETERQMEIDYWKGRPVKLSLTLSEDRLLLSIARWTDRWDVQQRTTPQFVYDALRSMVESATTNLANKKN